MNKINLQFDNRSAALGTKHKKETVIAPLFAKELNIKIKVPQNLDTDNFGTFTLDKKRPGNQKETVLLKARTAMKMLNLDIGIASEGVFGPHPAVPFGVVNTEIVVFIDNNLNLEIFGGHTEKVNYAQSITAFNLDEVLEFANRINFPKQAIVIKSSEKKYSDMVKGLVNKEELITTASIYLKKYKSIWLETDFRAHVNQSRMKNIELATKNLIENIKRQCPNCYSLGFHRIDPKLGLPCQQCGRPTSCILYDVYECNKCQYTADIIYPNKDQVADPRYCDYCNP